MGIPVPDRGSVTEDTGVVGGFITATGDIDYLFGDDTGDWTPATIAGSYGSTLVIDANGVWTYTADNSNPAIQALNTGETLTEVFPVTSANGNSTITITINGMDEPPCFVRGTPVDTPSGPRPVEELRAGDLVLTADHGARALRWVGRRRLRLSRNPEARALRPVRIRAHAFGPGVPARDVLVSPMHRVAVGGAEVELLFGEAEVLAAAQHLVNGRSIVREEVAEVDYVHLLLDRHEILTSHGLRSESLYPGDIALAGFDAGARAQVLGLLADLCAGGFGATARRVLKRHETLLLGASLAPPPAHAGALPRRAVPA